MDEIFITKTVKEKNHTTRQEEQKKTKNKTKLNFIKLKAQVELLQHRARHYTTKYQEIDQELLIEIKKTLHQNDIKKSYRNIGKKNTKKKKRKKKEANNKLTT